MKNNYRLIDKGLVIAILLFLFLPLLQSFVKLKKTIKPLNGSFVQVPDTGFGWNGWFNESFQEKKAAYLNQNFGFRNYYVRINNQADFTFFKKINAEHVVAGKAGVFFEDNYIDAYYGKNFVGKEPLEQLSKDLKEAQELLKSYGIDLEILLLPGKASYYPEFIPDALKAPKKISNYEYLATCLQKNQTDHIDFNAWFRQQKNKSVYDLYPAGGIHWSHYGAMLAFDSLLRHIETRTPLTLRSFRVDKIEFAEPTVNPDNDILDALNLWRTPRAQFMPYAAYTWLQVPNETKPCVLFVGDSYYWNWYYQGLIYNTFTDASFWYYNQTAYAPDFSQKAVTELPFKETIEQNKAVILMATETNVHDIGWGFARKVIATFKKKENIELPAGFKFRRQVYISYFKQEIKNTPSWFAKIKEKAGMKNISADSMIVLDAEYLYDTEYAKPEVIEYTEQTKLRIKNDPAWLKDVKAKARTNKVSVEEMLELDAKYIYDTEGKEK